MKPLRPQSRQPAMVDLVFLVWATVIPLAFSSRLLNSDGDLARHIRLGRDMLQQGAILTTDTFSWTRAGEPFLPFEWGSEVVFALVHRVAGLAGVAIVAGLLLALTYALVTRLLLRRGVDPVLAYATVTAGAIVSAVHWLARPHLFTFLLAVILLDWVEGPRRRSPWLYGALFLLWANLHGGFLLGLLILVVVLVGEGYEWWRGTAEVDSSNVRHRAAALGAATLGVLVNPHGIALYTHVLGFFGQSFIQDATIEFMSPDFHVMSGKLFLGLLLVSILGLSWSRRRPTATRLLLFLMLVAFSLIARRNIALFGIIGLPVLALHLDPEWRAIAWSPLVRLRTAVARDEARRTPWRWSAGLTVLLLLLAAGGGRAGSVTLVPNDFDGKIFPAHIVEEARRAGLEGRMFNHFIWGGWLLYAWPEQRVFLDGGTDHYGADLFQAGVEIMSLGPGWRDSLRTRDVSLVLMPPTNRLVEELSREPGWTVWECDAVGALLRRETTPPEEDQGEEGSRARSRQRLEGCQEAERALRGGGGGNS